MENENHSQRWVNKPADQIIRELLGVYGIKVQTSFQGQVVDSTLIVIDESVKALPVPNTALERCRKVDSDA